MLVATEWEMVEDLEQAPYLTYFIEYWKYGTLGDLTESVRHPEEDILWDYVN